MHVPVGFMRAAAFLIPMTMVGCQTESAPGAGAAATVSDSAGTRIVENAGSGDDPIGRLERVWRYGFAPGDYTFQAVFFGALRGDGSAVVGDMGSQEVVAVGATGGHHTVLARRGQGPSEVAGLRAVVGADGDLVWVEDERNAKLLLYVGDSLATMVSTREIPEVSFGLMAEGVDPEGRLLMTTATFPSDFTEPWFMGSMVRFDPGTGLADTVGVFPLAARYDGGPWSPYSVRSVVSAGGDGFVHGRTGQPEVIWRSTQGDVPQIARWHQEPAFPTDLLWTRFQTSLREDLRRVNPQMGGERLEEFVNEQIAQYTVDPEAPLPLFGALRGTADGGVWIAEFTPWSSWPTRYRVLAPGGMWLGTIEFPAPFLLLSVRGDLVLGVETDELEVQGVAVYRHDFGG